MKYLVLDTNVFLHYKDFEQVDWQSLLKDDVTICVPQRVLEEIDKHKDQSRGKIQKRAKRLSARFSELFLQDEAPRIPVEVLNHPLSTSFDDPHFHKEISDDWIILSALQSSRADTVIVSGDNGILLKAKQHGLGFFLMPDELLLADEASEEEKEIKQLRQRLEKYENRYPDPEVIFADETSLLTIEKPVFVDSKSELEKYEADLKNSFPYQSLTEEPQTQFNLLTLSSSYIHSTVEQKQEYNKELDDFFEKKILLKEAQLAKQRMGQRFYKLEFWLSNRGTSSLGDTAVFITFPDEVKVYNQNSKSVFHLEDPKEPVLKNNISSVIPQYNSTRADEKEIEIWSPDKALDVREFKFFSHRLTHGMRHSLGKEDIYIDIAQCGNFTIDWIIVDSELVEPAKGELHVVIKEVESAS